MPELIQHQQLEEAFRRLASKLGRDKIVGETHVFGGAAMVLAYQARTATRDVDALFKPRERVHSAAVRVADRMGLPRWWLNGQATAYLPRTEDETARLIFDHPNLRVTVVSPEHLLAMKALAARSYADFDDIATLGGRLGLIDIAAVEAVCSRIFPEEPLPTRSRLVEDVLQRPAEERTLDKGRSPGSEGPSLGL